MKNINKILGVVLTLALLAGLIVMAVPTTAADQYGASASDVFLESDSYPDFVMGTDTNVYTIAADGTTMFMWTKVQTALGKAIAVGDTTIYVASTEGFPDTGTIKINNAGADIAYSAKTNTTFTIPAAAAATSVNTAIGPGTTINAAAVYKSTDAGLTWSASNLKSPPTPAGVDVVSLKVCPTDITQLVATDGLTLYRSADGGKTWATISLASIFPLAADIHSIDIAANSDGLAILVGTNLGVALYTANTIGWGLTSNDTLGTTASWELNGNTMSAVGVAFSPQFNSDDNQILAVAYDATLGETYLVNYIIDDDDWNQSVKQADIGAIVPAGPAVMAFPTDYSWGGTNQVFVGLNDGAGDLGDLYRVNSNLTNNPVVRRSEFGYDVQSVAVAGTKSSSTVIAAATGMDGLMVSTDADTASSPAWTTDGMKQPVIGSMYYTGGGSPIPASVQDPTNVNLMLASTGILYVGVSDTHSCFYQASSDYLVYNGISRYEVANIYKASFSQSCMQDGGNPSGPAMFFFRQDGTNWVALKFENGGFSTVPQGQRAGGPISGNVFYYVSNAQPKQIQKSTDKGDTWTSISSPGNKAVTGFNMVSDTEYWIGYTGHIRSNTGAEISIAGVNEDVTNIEMIGKTGILVGTNAEYPNGPVTWLYSSDSGATFSIMGTQDQWSTATISQYFAAVRTVYIVDANGNLQYWRLDTDTSWQQASSTIILDGTSLKYVTKSNSTITFVSGVMYITMNRSSSAPAEAQSNTLPQIYRSILTEDGSYDFRPYPNSDWPTLGGGLSGTSVYDNADNTFNVKPKFTNLNQPYVNTRSNTGLGLLYEDTRIGYLTTVAPANDAQVNNPVDLSWNATPASGTSDYEYQVARDDAFNNIVTEGFTNGTSALDIGSGLTGNKLPEGSKYYWRVRLNNSTVADDVPGAKVANNNLNGFWSDTMSFTVKTLGNVNTTGIGNVDSVSPAKGAVDISTTPVLTWGVVENATYNIKIATDSAFTNVIDSKDGLTVAVYQPSKALEANKTYFWEVQAVSNGIASDWVAFAFTTSAAPTPTGAQPTSTAPVITVSIPTQPAPVITITQAPGETTPPGTPAYVWVIIVIGGILVIAVIVLIVRTRRV